MDGMHDNTCDHIVSCEMRHMHTTTHSVAHGLSYTGTNDSSTNSFTDSISYIGSNVDANNRVSDRASNIGANGSANDVHYDHYDHHVHYRAFCCTASARSLFTYERVRRHRPWGLHLR